MLFSGNAHSLPLLGAEIAQWPGTSADQPASSIDAPASASTAQEWQVCTMTPAQLFCFLFFVLNLGLEVELGSLCLYKASTCPTALVNSVNLTQTRGTWEGGTSATELSPLD